MNHRTPPSRFAVPLAVVAVTSPACNLSAAAPQAAAPTPLPAAATTAPLPTQSVAATATEAPPGAPSPTPAASAAPESEPIMLSATGGNLNIRRGPGLAYDVAGFLPNGQGSSASGRNDPAS